MQLNYEISARNYRNFDLLLTISQIRQMEVSQWISNLNFENARLYERESRIWPIIGLHRVKQRHKKYFGNMGMTRIFKSKLCTEYVIIWKKY